VNCYHIQKESFEAKFNMSTSAYFCKNIIYAKFNMSTSYTTNIFYKYKSKYFNSYVQRLDILKCIQN